MARESQGLQVLLIVFVMLTVVLGVTTYLYVKRADETTHAATAAKADQKKAEEATADKQKECDLLKQLIGMPERTIEEIKKQHDDDMATYGNARRPAADGTPSDTPLFDSNNLHYQRLLAGMFKTIEDRSAELVQSRATLADLQARFKTREDQKDEAMKRVSGDYKSMEDKIKQIGTDFVAVNTGTSAEVKVMVEKVTKVSTEAAEAQKEAEKEKKNARDVVAQKEKEIQDVIKAHPAAGEGGGTETPQGEITWVSDAQKMVWINRGQADGLPRQTKFTVYSADSSVGAKAVKKGQIEVMRIEGAHTAQCRILEDKLADPIMAGDKVFTYGWSPGQQDHFALAGVMNLDGDGRNQLNIVRGLITQNGGVIDCQLDEQGHKVGLVTPSTRFAVIGDPPEKNASPEFIKNNGEILRDVDRYQLRKLTLADFKQRMNYQKTSSVEHFGGASTSDVGRAASALKSNKAAASKAAPSEPKSDE